MPKSRPNRRDPKLQAAADSLSLFGEVLTQDASSPSAFTAVESGDATALAPTVELDASERQGVIESDIWPTKSVG